MFLFLFFFRYSVKFCLFSTGLIGDKLCQTAFFQGCKL